MLFFGTYFIVLIGINAERAPTLWNVCENKDPAFCCINEVLPAAFRENHDRLQEYDQDALISSCPPSDAYVAKKRRWTHLVRADGVEVDRIIFDCEHIPTHSGGLMTTARREIMDILKLPNNELDCVPPYGIIPRDKPQPIDRGHTTISLRYSLVKRVYAVTGWSWILTPPASIMRDSADNGERYRYVRGQSVGTPVDLEGGTPFL
ncbi:hypothetical protein MRB53_042316 [Persea americana]|nr:hypothetical protein MRB53_042316 [Persea americana]